MDLFSRYVFLQVSNALVMILGSLTAIVWIATSLKQVEGLSGGFFLFIKMTTLAMPQAMAIVAPIAFLIACLYSLNKLNLDSELIIMTASGATVWRFIMPYAVLGLIVSFIILINNLFIQPASLQQLRTYITQVRADLISHVLQAGKFSSPTGKMTFHIRDRDKNGDLLGMLVGDERDPKVQLTYLAERGKMIKLNGNVYLKMTNGHIHRKLAEKNDVQIVKFDQYIFDLTEFGQAKKGKSLYKTNAQNLDALFNPPKFIRKDVVMMGRVRSELHNRFSGALYPLFVAFLAVAVLGVARSTRQNSTKLLIAGFCIGILARMGGLAGINLLKAQPWAVWIVYGIPVGGILFCLFYIWYNMVPEFFQNFMPQKPRGSKVSERN